MVDGKLVVGGQFDEVGKAGEDGGYFLTLGISDQKGKPKSTALMPSQSQYYVYAPAAVC